MSLTPGQPLSQYEILAKLGEGGMGEVWRARDTRLDREVAIKVLPAELADDAERLQRFEREARTLAQLNHPNVAGIHGIEQVDGTTLLVMELVRGEDLAQRLTRGPLPVDEAIDVCRQIAEGLEAAHEAGVVHRDLKPANVCITSDGAVKVLDFGLAKPLTPGAANSTAQTDSFELTAEGMVLGTPTYMSPEQARGKPVDRRTDIWAWGCVFYECLTGARAFQGEAFGELMAAILTHDVDPSKLPAATPTHARRLIERALTKDPRARLRDIGEARVALAGGNTSTQQPPPTRRTKAMFSAGAAAACLVWLAVATLIPASEDAARPRPAGAMQLTVRQPVVASWPMVSPDGDRILYRTDEQLWLRDLSELEARPVPGTEGIRRLRQNPMWSADGASIAFVRDDSLEILRLGESRTQLRCAMPPKVSSCSWADNGAFLFEIGGRSQGIYYIAPDAEKPERLEWIDPTTLRLPHRFNPSFLPGGDAFLLTDSSGDESWIHVASLASRTTHPLVRGSYRAAYVAPGWLAWTDEGRLLVQPFDKETLRVSGAPHEVADGVDNFASTGESSFSFSSTGTLVYAPMPQPARIEWLDRQGHVLGPAEPRPYHHISLDRTGRWLAASVITPENGYRDLWIVDLERRTPQRFTDAVGWESTPKWSPDGKRIAFAADWTGPPTIYVQDVDAGEATEIVPFDNAVHYVGSWTPDGRQLLYSRFELQRGDLWIVDVDTKERRPLLESPHREADPQVSPDGRWIAYTSNESGNPEVYVATFPDITGSRRVSTEGGDQARWRPGSNELYYKTAARAIASATIGEQDGRPDPGTEVIVIQASEDLAQFDVTPDGDRFLVVRRTEIEMRPVSHLIVNWERLVGDTTR